MDGTDPITAFLMRDWAAVGGWGLFFTLVMFITIGAFKEWWVPGPRNRRTEDLLEKSVLLNESLAQQNGQLIIGNEITKHFFEETTPKRKLPPEVVTGDNGQNAGGVS